MDASIKLEASMEIVPDVQKWQYSLVSEIMKDPDMGEYRTYGIRLVTDEGIEMIRDVSVCRKTAKRIAALLNLHQISPIHFLDVISDLLP